MPVIIITLTSFADEDSINNSLYNRIMHQEKNPIKRIVRKRDSNINDFIQNKDDSLSNIDSAPYRIIIDQIIGSNAQTSDFHGEKYVIMINSSKEGCEKENLYKRNISEMYDSFTALGMSKKNIIVLENASLRNYFHSDTPSGKNLTKTVANLKSKITNKDLLILYFTGHGGSYYSFEKESSYSSKSSDSSSQDFLSSEGIVTINKYLRPFATWLIYAPCSGYSMTKNVEGTVIGQSFVSEECFASGHASHNLVQILQGVANNKKYIDLNNDGKYSIEEIAIVNALTYPNTLKELIEKKTEDHIKNKTQKRIREVHHLTYEDVDPAKIFINP